MSGPVGSVEPNREDMSFSGGGSKGRMRGSAGSVAPGRPHGQGSCCPTARVDFGRAAAGPKGPRLSHRVFRACWPFKGQCGGKVIIINYKKKELIVIDYNYLGINIID